MKSDNLNTIKTSGFKTPDDYFESFDEKLLMRLSNDTTIEGIDTPGFKTPDDYFKTLEDNVFNKLESENKSVIKLNTRKVFYYISGIAASLLLLFAIYINTKPIDESITIEMVETYLSNSDLDSYELAQLLSDAEILEEDFKIIETEYNEDNLESYLLENVDLESIIE